MYSSAPRVDENVFMAVVMVAAATAAVGSLKEFKFIDGKLGGEWVVTTTGGAATKSAKESPGSSSSSSSKKARK